MTVDTNSLVTVANSGPEKLAHLFLVSIHKGHAAFALLDELPGSNSTLPINVITALVGSPVVIWIIMSRNNLKNTI